MPDCTHNFPNIKIIHKISKQLIIDLRSKYQFLVQTMLDADDKLLFKTANHTAKEEVLNTTDDVPSKMTTINKFFFLTSKIPKTGIGQLWFTIRIATDLDYDEITAVTSYDLTSEYIKMMKKRLQSFNILLHPTFSFQAIGQIQMMSETK